jgi:integrase
MPATDASIAQYNSKLRMLRNLMGIEEGDINFLKKTVKVIKAIEGMTDVALNTRKAYYIAIVATLMTMKKGFTRPLEIYRQKQLEYNTAQSKIYDEQILSPGEKEKFLTWQDIVAIREKMKGDTDMSIMSKAFQDLVIISLYTYLPPARLDYGALKIVHALPEKLTGNYYYINSVDPEIVLTNYKTAKRYGNHHIKITGELSLLLKKYVSLLPEDAVYLLENVNDDFMSEGTLSRRISSVFEKYAGKNISVNILRHSYVTYHMEGQKSKREMDEFAKGLMHSTATDVIYRKLV